MESHLTEWLHLLIRWIHLVAAIGWIGSSFFFNWLNNQVRPEAGADESLAGHLWMIHGGAFYQVEKLKLAPKQFPKILHWFKWEAYFTWLSGFALLILIYYLNGGLYLLDPEVARISETAAMLIGVGTLAGGWLVYDFLWRSPLRKTGFGLTALSFLLLVLVTWGLSQFFSGRGVFIHVGGLLGTLMAGNVFFKIIPNQKKWVAALQEGREIDIPKAYEARQRSLHNNYLTLPVVFIMISSHFPFTYGSQYHWLILMALTLGSALVQHYFNVTGQGQKAVWIWPAVVVTLIAVVWASAPSPSPQSGFHAAAFPEVQQVIQTRCVSCHSLHPTDPVFSVAPNGIHFDTPAEIKAQAARIKIRAVDSKTMPLGNSTQMTEAERSLVGEWVNAGAPLE